LCLSPSLARGLVHFSRDKVKNRQIAETMHFSFGRENCACPPHAARQTSCHPGFSTTILAYQVIREIPLSDYVEPLGKRILIRKDESRQKTRGGIVLPDSSEIPTITGRVVEISVQIERDHDFPLQKYDKVLFHPKNAIPVDFEADNLLFVVPIEDVVAIFRRAEPPSSRKRKGDPSDLDEKGMDDPDDLSDMN